MWRLSIGLLVFVSLQIAGCATFPGFGSRSPASQEVSQYIDPRYQEFVRVTNEALTFRAFALKFAAERTKDGEWVGEFSREELETIVETGRKYLQTRKGLWTYPREATDLFSGLERARLAPGQGTKFVTVQRGRGRTASTATKALQLDPTEKKGQEYFFQIQMGLAAGLLLMDNYFVAILPYEENPGLRYKLNYDGESDLALRAISKEYASPSNRAVIARAIEFVDRVMDWRRQNMLGSTPEETHMYELIQSSLWYIQVRSGKTGAFSNLADYAENLWKRLGLRTKRGLRIASFGISMGFGNLVGLHESRKGFLYKMSEEEQAQLISEMKPLDILFEKTPFRLTDRFIPGHYGHVAIWTGTEEQLRELNVWDQIPEKIQKQIQAGHYIVEALRPGVQINTLAHFLNIDDFLVLRDKRPNIDDEYRRQAILKAIRQVGKEYDFNFDVKTFDRIVCSEIAYVVYDDVKWPTEVTLRRSTISPDNVVQMAVGDQPILEPVIMYYKGNRVYRGLAEGLPHLLDATDESYAKFEKLVAGS